MSTTKALSRKLHTLLGKLGISDDDYRAMLAEYHVTTSKDLAYVDYRELVNNLEDMAVSAGVWQRREYTEGASKKRFDDLGRRTGMASPPQLRKIEAMWAKVSRAQTARDKRTALNHFLAGRFGVERIEWLPFETVPKVIRAIAAMGAAEQ